MTDGIVLIDKPSGMTSFGLVARLRRALSKEAGQKIKVGHTGTLDPFATGLMILVVGKECKNAAIYTKLDKVYEATIILGQTSTTGDPEGEVSNIECRQYSRIEIEAALDKFRGKINQRPPIFSAIKINGRRAYQIAREGKKVEIPIRQVEIYSLEIVDYQFPVLKIKTHVSSGTYIRSLAADIGRVLGTGAYCRQLRRIQIADYDIKDSKQLLEYNIDS